MSRDRGRVVIDIIIIEGFFGHSISVFVTGDSYMTGNPLKNNILSEFKLLEAVAYPTIHIVSYPKSGVGNR